MVFVHKYYLVKMVSSEDLYVYYFNMCHECNTSLCYRTRVVFCFRFSLTLQMKGSILLSV